MLSLLSFLLLGLHDPTSCLDRTASSLEACRADLPAMAAVADQAAERLVGGGKIWVAGQASMVSELTGRAGGMMMIRALGEAAPAAGDVVLLIQEATPVRPTTWPAETLVVGIGDCDGMPAPNCFPSRAREFDLAPSFANIGPAWVMTAEIIGALTRRGKMPVMYETIGLYGGYARIDNYKGGEIPFHDDLQVTPVPPGALGGQYIDRIQAMLVRVKRTHSKDINTAAKWSRQTKTKGRTAFLYSMGHLFPAEVDNTALGEYFKSGTWNAAFHTLPQAQDAFSGGDTVIHLGYQHAPEELLKKVTEAGAKIVYISVHQSRDYHENTDVRWIDCMWDWPDGCVTLEGYDIPFLPASGVVNSAIAWEIYRQTQP